MKMPIYIQIVILYRIRVWRKKSLANLVDFSKLPNFICQKLCNSAMYYYHQYFNDFAKLLFRQIDFLHFCQTFLSPNFCSICVVLTKRWKMLQTVAINHLSTVAIIG